MYPFFRLARVSLKARKQPKIDYQQPTSIEFYCHPWDIDTFGEMNNGRILTLYDLGRTHLAIRCNLLTTLMKNKWALVVAGSSVRYRKRVKMFDKITMHTQCVGTDDKWFYVEQSMWVNGTPCSSVLIRAGITAKAGLVKPEEVADAMGTPLSTAPLPAWVQEWVGSELHRPWPPLGESSEPERPQETVV